MKLILVLLIIVSVIAWGITMSILYPVVTNILTTFGASDKGALLFWWVFIIGSACKLGKEIIKAVVLIIE